MQEVQQEFGQEIANYVEEVTDDKSLSPSERKKLQIINAPTKSIGAAHIKLADKYDNCLDLTQNPPVGWSIERIQGYFLWSRTVVRAVAVNTEVATELKSKLEIIFAGCFYVNGEKFNCIPDGDEQTLLQRYYASLDAKR